MKQRTFADLEYDAKKRTRREQFLDEMDRVIPWAHWTALIEPHYPKAGLGRRPMPLQRMLRIHLLQQWFNLSDPAVEEMLIDSQSMRRFAGINLMDDPVPDETTILKFRHLLEANGLAEKLFRDVGMLLTERGLMPHKGTTRRCDHHQRSAFHEESGPRARSRHEPGQEEKHVALRHEGAYRRRSGQRVGAHPGDDDGTRIGSECAPTAAAWRGTGGLGRSRLWQQGRPDVGARGWDRTANRASDDARQVTYRPARA